MDAITVIFIVGTSVGIAMLCGAGYLLFRKCNKCGHPYGDHPVPERGPVCTSFATKHWSRVLK